MSLLIFENFLRDIYAINTISYKLAENIRLEIHPKSLNTFVYLVDWQLEPTVP